MIELKELTEKTLKIFDCNSVKDLGNALLGSLEDEIKLQAFSDMVGNDLTKDWLQMIFQYYQADRKDKKQDYTPKCLAQFLSRLIGESSESIDMCAGSGALTIQRWVENPDTVFCCYEIDEKVIPYLLFNLVIRNISATVNQCDILQDEIYKTWEITKGEKYGKITYIKSTV
jgi:type I restriction enzyme M protein